jgi:type VI secretion system secreted protein Hcp
MAQNGYLWIHGTVQGDIAGSVTLPGRESSILVLAASHEIVSPRDPASGLPTGKRQHQPLVIVKEVDRASAPLYRAIVNNENLASVILEFWRAGSGGIEAPYYRMELVNAAVAAIKAEMLNNAYPENVPLKERERVAFTYQRITWTYLDGPISAEDDWEAPVA